MRAHLAVILLIAVSAGGACGGGGSSAPISCGYSTASTGEGSCQVNFYCEGGDLAVYCLGNATGGSDCTCHQGAMRTPLDMPGLCKLSGQARVEAVRMVCGWNL